MTFALFSDSAAETGVLYRVFCRESMAVLRYFHIHFGRRSARCGSRKLVRPLAFGALCLLIAVAGVPLAEAQEGASYETIKAHFVFNFLKFVQWPKEAFENKKSPIVIGVFTNEDFSRKLEAIVRGKTIGDRPVEVVQSDDVKDLLACHLVYFEGHNEKDLAKAVHAFEKGHTLTVGDARTFSDEGGIIRLFQERKKVRFEVNLRAARKKELKVSSKLLGLAAIVRGS